MNPMMSREMLMAKAAQAREGMMGAARNAAPMASRVAPLALGAGAVAGGLYGASQLMGGGGVNPSSMADAAYQQQLADQIATAERAGQFKQNVELAAAEAAYNQQMGLANDQQDYEMAKFDRNLQAQQAEQVLNGHLAALAEGRNAAASVGQARFY